MPKSSSRLPGVSIGFNMAVGMGLFTSVGYLIDQKTGGGQGWTLAGIFVGLFYCGYEVWKLVQRLNENNDKDTQRKAQ